MSTPLVVGSALGTALSIALLGRAGSPHRRPTGEQRPTSRGRPRRLVVRRRTGSNAAVVFGGVLVLVALGPVGLVAGAVSWWFLVRLRPLLAERRRERAARDALPDTVDLLVLAIRSGLTPHLAVRALERRAPSAARGGFEAVARRLDRGSVLADALPALTTATHPSYGPIVDALVTSERHGTPLAAVLDQLALESRRRRRADAEARVRTLPVRMSFPLVVCVLPAFVLVAIAPAVMAALSSLGSPPW